MRRLVEELHGAFEKIHLESVRIIEENEFEGLNRENEALRASVCELVVRSAAKVEQSCGGITTRLWDDPFEWTLPESLDDKKSVLDYLEEVAAVRIRAFDSITSDDDLTREIAAPEKLTTLFLVLLESLTASSNFLNLATIALHSGERKAF